nr:hypothetical protein [Pseudomonadota bacterium]
NITGADVVIAVLGFMPNFAGPISSTFLIASGQAFNITDNANPNSGFGSIMAGIDNFHGSSADDFAIANPTTGTVYVLFGDTAFNTSTPFDVSSLNGNNGFALTAPVGFEITAVGYVGDVNGDSFADMGVATYNSATFASDLYVIFGHGGVFSPTMSIVSTTIEDGLILHHYGPAGANEISNITGADFNGDGLRDIVYTNEVGLYTTSSGGVTVIFGDNFSNHITIQADASTPYVINGTNNDVIFAGTNDHTINLGTGDNYFNPGVGNDIINGGTGNDTIVFSEFLVGVSGGSGNDTLSFQQDGIIEDFTATAIFSGIDNIGLKGLLSNVGNQIELNAATVNSMSDSNHLTINGGGMDSLTLSNNGTDAWTQTVGPVGYTTYIATGGLNIGATVDVANTMHPVVLV